MKPPKTVEIAPSSEGLRSILIETLKQFCSGEIDHIHAKTVAKVCDSINKSLALDIEASRFVRETGTCLADLHLNVALVKPVIEQIEK